MLIHHCTGDVMNHQFGSVQFSSLELLACPCFVCVFFSAAVTECMADHFGMFHFVNAWPEISYAKK